MQGNEGTEKGKGRDEGPTKEMERLRWLFVTGVANKVTSPRTAEQQSTTQQMHQQSDSRMEQPSGITQTMGMTLTCLVATQKCLTKRWTAAKLLQL